MLTPSAIVTIKCGIVKRVLSVITFRSSKSYCVPVLRTAVANLVQMYIWLIYFKGDMQRYITKFMKSGF